MTIQPVHWYIQGMKEDSVVNTRRDKPIAGIDPVETDKFSVWEDRVEYIARTGRLKQEFDLPPRSPELPASPLDD